MGGGSARCVCIGMWSHMVRWWRSLRQCITGCGRNMDFLHLCPCSISYANHQEDRSFDAHDYVECELGFQQRWILTKLQSLIHLISALTLLWKPGKVAVMTEYLHFHRWTPKIELLQYLKLLSLFSRELHLELISAYCSTWADCQSHSSTPTILFCSQSSHWVIVVKIL